MNLTRTRQLPFAVRSSSSPSVSRFRPASRGRNANYWSFLAFLWAAYYLAIGTIGRYEDMTQRVIWIGAGFLGLMMVVPFFSQIRQLPKEGLLLAGFSFWCLSGIAVVGSWPDFLNYLKLVVEFTLIVIGVGIVIGNSGRVNILYLAFIAVAVFQVLMPSESQAIPMKARVSAGILQERAGGITGQANTLANVCLYGIFGVMAILGESRSWWSRGSLLAAAFVCLYGLVQSAGRQPAIVLGLALVLWPLMCLRERLRGKLPALIIASVLVMGSGAVLGTYALAHTYLGQRLERAARREDTSTQIRLELGVKGFELFLANPLLGVGLGQFPIASGMGFYAHDEFIELLSTTGLVGFLLCMGVYGMAWWRLTRVLRRTGDVLVCYRVNFARMVLIVLLVGGLSRPNFIESDTQFLIAMIVGVAHWAERVVGRRKDVARSGRRAPVKGARLMSHV